jgi:iron complex transport system substrate-binding protein
MKATTLLQTGWLVLLLLGVVLVSLVSEQAGAAGRVAPPHSRGARAPLPWVELPDGKRGLADAGGYVVPLAHYRRIASGGSITDELLLHLAEPERVQFLTRYGREHSLEAYRYGDRPSLAGPTDLDTLQRSKVDLLLVHHFGPPAELARAREAGVQVFNLGEMRGLETLIPNIRVVAALLGHPERGERLIATFTRRMKAVAADLPATRRKRAVYVSAYGGQLFGGGRRSSYHDVLTAAGLLDPAAERYDDYPHYDPEQLIDLDPEIIVTTSASVQGFCAVNGLAQLRACRDGARGVVGLDDALLSNPGLGMLDAAEALRDLVYGSPN